MTIDVLERHTSPDGTLTFVVATEDEDVVLGLECNGLFDWHTHGESLGFFCEMEPKQAVRSFVDDLLNDKLLIAISEAGEERKVWITSDPVSDLDLSSETEVLDFRFWTGSEVYRGREVLTSGVEWINFTITSEGFCRLNPQLARKIVAMASSAL